MSANKKPKKKQNQYDQELRLFQIKINDWDQKLLVKEYEVLSKKLDVLKARSHAPHFDEEEQGRLEVAAERDLIQRKLGALELEIGFRKARREWAW